MKSNIYKNKLVFALVVFLISVLALIPSALTLPEHGDEAIYAWGGNYFFNKILKLDFNPQGTDDYTDPGWDPNSIWASTGPNITRIIYGLSLAITKVPVPEQPYAWGDPTLQGPETHLSLRTLHVIRFTAIVCAALGFAIIAFRWRWRGLCVAIFMLLIPHVRDDLARGWAEGPLLMGIGLSILAYGTYWFSIVVGMAGTLKFTAMGIWPFILIPGANGRWRFSQITGLFLALVTWSFLTPPSWFMGGPIYIIYVFIWRISWWLFDAHRMVISPTYTPATPEIQNPLGLFVPTRYLWPIELILISGLVWGVPFAISCINLKYQKFHNNFQ
jgi:hypothetical protein